MLIYILLGLLIAMFAAVYIKFNKDIFSPPLLFLLAYIVSVGSAVLNVSRWNIEMAPVTFAVLLAGAVEFVAIGIAVDMYFTKKSVAISADCDTSHLVEKPLIDVAWWKIIAVGVISLVYLVLLYINVLDIAGKFGDYSSFSQVLNLFKTATSATLTYALPWWLEQTERILMVCAFVFLYIFMHDISALKKPREKKAVIKEISYLVPVAAYFVNGVLMSDRLMIMQTLIAGIIMFFLFWCYRTGKAYISVKALLSLAGAACLGLAVFYISAEFIGRINSKGPIEYITYYCGGSIECLNQFFKAPPAPSDIIGKETFYNFNRKLYDLGLLKLDSFYPIHLEFRYYNDVMLGNVYTAYRRWIYDFGYVGAFILQGIMAFAMSWFYNRLKYKRFKNTGFAMVLYGYLAYTVILHPIDGYLYVQYVSLTFIVTVLLMWLAHWFFVNCRVQFRGGFTVFFNERWRLEKFRLKKTPQSEQ